MILKGFLRKGEYFDSVTLMIAAKKIRETPGVHDAAVVMGTKENREILKASGLLIQEFRDCEDSDLLIAVKAKNDAAAGNALRQAEEHLTNVGRRSETSSQPRPRNLEEALKLLPDANLAMISISGRYAGDVAMQALQNGLHVMIFSDNVSLEKEVQLKRYAKKRRLLVMGPDCGTAILNGIPLAFANVVKRGDVGIVAAAGTGLQEVSSILSNEGVGISQAIGTGGRDVKKEVGGLMFMEGLLALAEDPSTRRIVLISKPPHETAAKKILQTARRCGKPCVVVFLGQKLPRRIGPRLYGTNTLEEAALTAAALCKKGKPDPFSKRLRDQEKEEQRLAKYEAEKKSEGQKYIRGLFSGGALCAEAQVVFRSFLREVHSNAPIKPWKKLENSLSSLGHTAVDLGEDEFTVGRPHPMIDYSLRNSRILEEAKDPGTAVILLDVVLGYGSHPDPSGELCPAILKARAIAKNDRRHLSLVCSITGTAQDPQDRKRVRKNLQDAGALVLPSNASAGRTASHIVRFLEMKHGGR